MQKCYFLGGNKKIEDVLYIKHIKLKAACVCVAENSRLPGLNGD